MSDIFWITGARIENNLAALGAALQDCGLPPGWIEEVHWVGDQVSEVQNLLNGSRPLIYRWPGGVLPPDFLLHDICRSMELRERNLLLMAEEEGDRLYFTVLGSPRSVGQHNLMPHAHIAGWWAVPQDGLPGLPQKLEKSGYDLGMVTWLSGAPALLQQAQAVFPESRPLHDEPAAVTGRLNHLIHHLSEEKCSHGLMLGQAPGGPLLATLVER